MKYIVSAMSSAALVAALFSAPAFSADPGPSGTVNFEGSISAPVCVVDLDGAGGTTMNVLMGDFPKSAFRGVGSTTSAKPFNITLRDCPSTVSAAQVAFSGTGYAGDSTVLALTAGGAEGVAIQLSDSSGVLPLTVKSVPHELDHTAPNILNFSARYIQKETDIVEGAANSTATFLVTY